METIDLLKLMLMTLLALITLNYTKSAGDIIFMVDASLNKCKEVLMQLVKEKKHPLRYESGI